MRKITLAVPNYNRCNFVVESFIQVLNQGLIDEIVINDDGSDENIFLSLKKEIQYLNSDKIKLYRNPENLGAFLNKLETVKKATNDWVILLDSDNKISIDYLLSIPKELDETCIYLPNRGVCSSDLLNYDIFLGKNITKEDYLNMYLSEEPRTQCLLNSGNYFFNKHSYIKSVESESEILNSYAADVYYLIYLWMKNIEGANMLVVKNMNYTHHLHNSGTEQGSHYQKYARESADFIKRIGRKKLPSAANFLKKSRIVYPPGNEVIFEEYFHSHFKQELDIERIYIPVLWTHYYINASFDGSDHSDLATYISSLDRTKKYFTVVQYDDNILNDLSGLDVLIFAQGGYGKYKDVSYPIPLNCTNNFVSSDLSKKDIFCSFVGTIKRRHPIREELEHKLSGNPKYLVQESKDYPYFNNIMSRSIFALCPRGYGQTSFRICESLQANTIPVYIFDDPLIPFEDKFDFNEIGVLLPAKDIYRIDEILSSITDEQRAKMIENGRVVYKKYFEYEGCLKEIINILKNKL